MINWTIKHPKENQMVDNTKRYILCAAIHWDDGEIHINQPKNIKTGFVVCGRRHNDIFMTLHIMGYDRLKHKSVQGFLTNDNGFFDRKVSYDLAKCVGQIVRTENMSGTRLTSEHLYVG